MDKNKPNKLKKFSNIHCTFAPELEVYFYK